MKGQGVLIFDFLCFLMRVLAEEKRNLGEDGWFFITQRGTKDGTKGREDENRNKLKRRRFCNDYLWINK
jgi:hypothetical protein